MHELFVVNTYIFSLSEDVIVLAFIPVCCDRIAYRKEGVNASVAMEHMIPDLLISEKVDIWLMLVNAQNEKYSIKIFYYHHLVAMFSSVIWICCFDGPSRALTLVIGRQEGHAASRIFLIANGF